MPKCKFGMDISWSELMTVYPIVADRCSFLRTVRSWKSCLFRRYLNDLFFVTPSGTHDAVISWSFHVLWICVSRSVSTWGLVLG